MNIVNDQEKTFSVSEGVFENEFVLLDNHNANIFFKRENVEIKLTELQRRFMFTLLKGENKKNEIIKSVWFYNHETIADNNYHQIVFQCRALLARHEIPGDIIKTIPRYGVMLSFHDYAQAVPESSASNEDNNKESDARHQCKIKPSHLSFIKNKFTFMVMTALSCAAFFAITA